MHEEYKPPEDADRRGNVIREKSKYTIFFSIAILLGGGKSNIPISE